MLFCSPDQGVSTMARAVITNAAGPTEGFLHHTGIAREESVSETRLVLSARIIDGPFKGERSTMTFIGTFDLETGLARLSEVRETVDGRLHFLFTFDRPFPLEADFPGDLREPIILTGNRFANHLEGMQRADRIFGNAGADELVGMRGGDTLVGGFGADEFIYLRASESTPGRFDTIRDFGRGADVIDLNAVDADEGIRGDQDFDFIGSAGFSGAAGELRIGASGRLVLGDTDGDRAADLLIRLAGAPGTTEDDFIL
jgi:hypothetical protein